MSSRKVIIKNICKLNRETIRSNNQPNFINYLDTGNITRNKIDEIKNLVNGVDKFPSRAQRKVQKNTIIYSTVRPEQEHFGIIENLIDNLIVSTGFTTLDVIDDTIDAKYFYYSLTNKSITEYLNIIAANNVTSYPSLNPSDIGNLVLKIPSIIIEQQKIAKVLSDLDAKIEINNHINTELEAMAKTLYDYWFVQFDFPDANGKPYKSSGGKMIWNEDLKREIPEGWEVQSLNKVIETILDHRGKTPKKLGSDWTDDENGIIALSAKIVKGGKLNNLRQANKVSKELYEKWMPIKLIDGDILMTSEAPAGEFYFIQGKTDYCMSQRLFGIRANQMKMVPSYLYYELSKGNGYSQIMGSLSGSTVFGIRQDVLRKILVVVPNLEIQKEFNKIVLPQLKQIKQLDEQNQELASLRDWLLPMLMNGQVSVGDVEEQLGMVAEDSASYGK
jgi:type I restriction enzyme S subunit